MLDVVSLSGLLILSLCALPITADLFLTASEKVGLRLGLSSFAVGITLVAFGTSAPELVASIIAVLSGASEIVAGTVIGSNITNMLLILSAAAVLGGGLRVDYDLVRVDLPFLFGSALLFALFAFDGRIGAVEGILLLAALAIYISYAALPREAQLSAEDLTPELKETPVVDFRVVALGVVGLIGLQLAAWGTVKAVVGLSALTPFGSDVLAASLVAFGTSVPELVVSVRAAHDGKPELAVGNVIGSNVFNVLGVVGAAAMFGPLVVTPQLAGFGLASLMGATALCFFVLQEREVTRWDGGLLSLLYLSFILQLYGALG